MGNLESELKTAEVQVRSVDTIPDVAVVKSRTPYIEVFDGHMVVRYRIPERIIRAGLKQMAKYASIVMEACILPRILEDTHNNKSKVSEKAGISYKALLYKLLQIEEIKPYRDMDDKTDKQY